ncbi:MAG: hypothetical protein ACE145_21605 [Terriglobia bacterium]
MSPTTASDTGKGTPAPTGVAPLPLPQSVDELGIRKSSLEDLALKIVYVEGELTVKELAAKMRISYKAADELFQSLRKTQLLEVKGMVAGVHRIVASAEGRARASELFTVNQYTGPAPVSFKEYVGRVRAQSVKNFPVRQELVEHAFEHLVLTPQTLRQLGTAVVSGTSIMLYGPTGTGKTSIAESIPRIYHDRVWVPYAVQVDAHVIMVYDPIIHQSDDKAVTGDYDTRWVPCHRPRVIVGGELTIDMLDLQFHPVSKFYAAPVQMKANNGALILDDFGRQRITPEELLNRWTVPLDRGMDFFSLMGGRKLEVPFDLFVVFATNLNPSSLADEAFLRRIHNKIKIDNIDAAQFHLVFERVCKRYELKYDRPVVDSLIELLATEWKQPLRPCYPSDLINQVLWVSRYEGKPPQINRETLSQACHNYFLAP